jgi:predicted metal-dependent hydrolase
VTTRPFPAAYRAFIALFNRGAYWDSHEALEAAWRDTGSDFYQGLILLASAFVHVGRGNAHGVRAQLAKAEARLRPFRPAYLGLDVDAVLAACAAGRAALMRGAWPAALRLALDPGLVRGDEPEGRGPLEPPPAGA